MTDATSDPTGHDRTAASAAAMEQAFQLYKMIASLKAQAQSRSSHLLLFPLWRLGPSRQSALAELSHIDPSTTSRHVADLVREGLVERRPDPADGRASLLALTPAGDAALARIREQRAQAAARALADWSVSEIETFGADLSRFTTAMAPLLQELSSGAPQPTPTSHQHATSTTASQEDR